MDIKITHSLLTQYLDTKATPEQIADALSLCGPTVDRLTKLENGDYLYEIEVITNRVDAASAYGIAREATAILPEFKHQASLKMNPYELTVESLGKLPEKTPVAVTVNPTLAPRFSCIALTDISVKPSPKASEDILLACGERPLNNVIDISNELTLKFGQPVHVFDLDRIKGNKMLLRESKFGEKVITLDGKTHTLKGGDIIIEDGSGRLIDLCGVMGGDLSSITEATKNVLLFVQAYEPKHIRRTSLYTQERTLASQLFEKHPDPEMVLPVLIEGVKLLQERAGGVISSSLIDLYPHPIKTAQVDLDLSWLTRFAGVSLPEQQVKAILDRLGIHTNKHGSILTCTIPSFRRDDLKIKEDLAEEVMRVYGYFKLPSIIPNTDLPKIPTDPFLTLESKIRQLLVNGGATEIYNYSLVAKADSTAFKLANPLSEEYVYMRQSLLPSLIAAREANRGSFDKPYALFELANVYTKAKKGQLADETPHLAIVWNQTDYRKAKGLVAALFSRLNISSPVILSHIEGVEGSMSFEIDLAALFPKMDITHHFKPVPKTPAVVEDLTFTVTDTTYEKLAQCIQSVDPLIESVDLKDIYKQNYTFAITYRASDRTLTNDEVAPIRKQIVAKLEAQNIKLVGKLQ